MAIDPSLNDPRLLAAIDMVGRTGALGIQIRYSDDEQPIVWFVVAKYRLVNGMPVSTGGQVRYEVGAGFRPLEAVLRLCEAVVDGGHCVHCNRPSGFTAGMGTMPASDQLCWYQWDPELRVFRRGCEGSAP